MEETQPEGQTQPSVDDGNSFTSPELDTQQQADSADVKLPLQWTASEFIAHEKSTNWYLALAGSSIGLALLIFLFTRDFISSAVVLIGAATLGYYAGRQPRELPYVLNDQGFSIGNRAFRYDDFRCFAVVPEGHFLSVIFLPLKRFSPTVTIYLPPELEDSVVDVLEPRLPFEEYAHDAIDRLMRRIRF